MIRLLNSWTVTITYIHTHTHTRTQIIIILRRKGDNVTTPLRGSRHHHPLLALLRPCQRRTHTKTPWPWERRRTYQGYGCPVRQWLSSRSLCGGAEGALAAYHRFPYCRIDDAARVPSRGRQTQQGVMSEYANECILMQGTCKWDTLHPYELVFGRYLGRVMCSLRHAKNSIHDCRLVWLNAIICLHQMIGPGVRHIFYGTCLCWKVLPQSS